MRSLALTISAFFAACNSNHSQGQSPDAPPAPVPDASGGDAASVPDAATTALGRDAIVFAAALDGQADTDLYVLDRTTVTRLTQTVGGELYPAISPDRKTIAFVRDFQLFAIDAAGDNERLIAPRTGRQRLGENGQVRSTTLGPAAWSPDGTQLAYPYPRDPYLVEVDPGVFLDENGGTTVHIINADGTGDHVVPNLGDSGPAATINSIGWGPDNWLSMQFADDCPDCAGGSYFVVIKTDGTELRQISFGDPNSGHVAPNAHLDWSPDGTRWVFVDDGGYGAYELPGYIHTSTAFVDDERQLVTEPAWNPRWSPDAVEVAYIGADGIYVIASGGGVPRRALAITDVHGLDW